MKNIFIIGLSLLILQQESSAVGPVDEEYCVYMLILFMHKFIMFEICFKRLFFLIHKVSVGSHTHTACVLMSIIQLTVKISKLLLFAQ